MKHYYITLEVFTAYHTVSCALKGLIEAPGTPITFELYK